MVLDRQHVAREAGGGIGFGVGQLLFHPPPRILQLGGGIEHLRIGILQLLVQLGELIMLPELGRFRRGLGANLLGFLVQLVVIVVHAIHLVRAWAVKSTMGTTRA